MVDLTGTDRAIRATHRQPLFSTSADRGWAQRFRLATQDVIDGFVLWRLCWALGVADVRLRYRGSVLGPFWLTLSTAVMIGAMGFLYADLFHTNIHTYLPYLGVSLILWNFLGSMVLDAGSCFTGADGLIKGTRMPFTVHALRSVVRDGIVFGHNIIVIFLLFIFFSVHVSFYCLLAIPGLLLWLIDGFALAFMFGAFCARYRDVPQIIGSLMQIAFFVTPVMWNASVLAGHPRAELIIRLNPFYYLLEIVRGPLIGDPLTFNMVAKAVIVSLVLVLVSALAFARTRGRLAYWM